MTIDWNARLATRTTLMTSSAIRELLKVAEQPDIISFAGGFPAPEVFPTEEVERACSRILRNDGTTALQYGATEGYRPLRHLLATQFSSDDLHLTEENVMITTGSQQGLDLLGKIFLDAGDTVVVESPTYLAAVQAWRSYEARFVTVGSDDDGLRVDQLEPLLDHDPKLLYTLPNFQNPSGVTLSATRRDELVRLAARYRLPVVEDDPYRDLRFDGDHLPRLIELDARLVASSDVYHGGIISLGTFSKILSPGLRVGWVVAAPEIIRQLVRAKQGADLHTAMLNQMIAYDLLGSGFLEEHRRVIVSTYRTRRDVMLESLAEHFPATAHWTYPFGGMFLWVVLPSEIDTSELLQTALARGVAFVPGVGFHADGSGHNTMRLNFSNSTPDQIRDGIARVGHAIQETMHALPAPTAVS